jgi:hypothetical protein
MGVPLTVAFPLQVIDSSGNKCQAPTRPIESTCSNRASINIKMNTHLLTVVSLLAIV